MPHVVITGASRRLGLFLTQKFLSEHWQVTAVTRAASDELTALTQPGLTVLTCNTSDSMELETLADQLQSTAINLLIHNASYFAPDPIDPLDNMMQLKAMLTTHVEVPGFLNQRLLPALAKAEKPCIIHMSDIYVENPNAKFANYCASKAALENLSKSYAKRFAPNIRVNTIQPGALKFLPEHTEAAKKKVLADSLIQQEAGFEPIYQTIQFIVTNPFITGTAVKVDGGRSICR